MHLWSLPTRVGHQSLCVAVGNNSKTMLLLLLVEHLQTNNAGIVLLHCFRSTLKENPPNPHARQKVLLRHQAMVSVNMPQAIWNSRRIRSPRNYDSPADSRVSRFNTTNTLPDSIPLNSETLWSEMSSHLEIPEQSPMITHETFYGIIYLLIRNHRAVCYLL